MFFSDFEWFCLFLNGRINGNRRQTDEVSRYTHNQTTIYANNSKIHHTNTIGLNLAKKKIRNFVLMVFLSVLSCSVTSFLSLYLSLCVCFCLATFLLALMSELLIFLILLNMFAFRCVGAVLTLLVCIRINCFLSLYWNGVGGSSSNVKNLDKHGFWLQCVTIK